MSSDCKRVLTAEQETRSADATSVALRRLISEMGEEVLRALIELSRVRDTDGRDAANDAYSQVEWVRERVEWALATYIAHGDDPRTWPNRAARERISMALEAIKP